MPPDLVSYPIIYIIYILYIYRRLLLSQFTLLLNSQVWASRNCVWSMTWPFCPSETIGLLVTSWSKKDQSDSFILVLSLYPLSLWIWTDHTHTHTHSHTYIYLSLRILNCEIQKLRLLVTESFKFRSLEIESMNFSLEVPTLTLVSISLAIQLLNFVWYLVSLWEVPFIDLKLVSITYTPSKYT